MFLCKRSICFILENFALLLNHFLVKISTANIDKVVKMLFSERWSNANEDTLLTQLSFSTKSRSWNNDGSSTLNRRNSVDVVSTLFYQHWNNFDKCTSAFHFFNFHFQPNINIETTLMNVDNQRSFNVDSTLMCLLGYSAMSILN